MKINNKKFLLVSIGLLFLFVLFIGSYKYDHRIIELVAKINSNNIVSFWALFITNLGNLVTFFLIALFIILIFDYKKGRNVFENLIISIAFCFILKYLLIRERPDGQLIKAFGYSFPSAHAMISTTFYGYLMYLVNTSKLKKIYKYLFNLCMTLIIILVCTSRVILGVHYLSDVMGGILFGIITLLLFILYSNTRESIKDETIRLDKSFRYAITGIKKVIINEKNMQIHMLAVIVVTAMGAYFKITKAEWLVCLTMFSLVLSAEIFNTAMEKVVDYISLKKCNTAKDIKDMAAGAVLVNAIIAAIVGLIIFVPYIIKLF